MNKKPDIWMPFYIGDFLADTMHLSTEQKGAYLLLLFHSWRTGPLPSGPAILRRIVGLEADAWSIAWPVLREFFVVDQAGSLIQGRLQRERRAWGDKKEKADTKARHAADVRWNLNARSNAQAELGECPLPSPSSEEQKQKPSGPSFQDAKTSTSSLRVVRSTHRSLSEPLVVPAWIDAKVWKGFLESRTAMRVPNSAYALALVIVKLNTFRAAGHDPNVILTTSVESGWKGVFAPKDFNPHGAPMSHPKLSAFQKLKGAA